MKIDPAIIESNRTMPNSWSPREGGEDRVDVIVAVAELEDLARQALTRFAASRNPHLSGPDVTSAVNMAGVRDDTSLKQLARVLHLVGLIDRELRDDLVTLYTLRTEYAHRAKLGQLNDEPELAAVIRNMECFKQTRIELEQLPSMRHIYRAIKAHLRQALERT
jgi:hypothetical protein